MHDDSETVPAPPEPEYTRHFKFEFTPGPNYNPLREEQYPIMYKDGSWYVFVDDAIEEMGATLAIEACPEDFVNPQLTPISYNDELLITSLKLESVAPDYYGVVKH